MSAIALDPGRVTAASRARARIEANVESPRRDGLFDDLRDWASERVQLVKDRQPSIYRNALVTGFDWTVGEIPYAGKAASAVFRQVVDRTSEATIDADDQLRDLASRAASVLNRVGTKDGWASASELLAQFDDLVQVRVRPEIRDEAAITAMWQGAFESNLLGLTSPTHGVVREGRAARRAEGGARKPPFGTSSSLETPLRPQPVLSDLDAVPDDRLEYPDSAPSIEVTFLR